MQFSRRTSLCSARPKPGRKDPAAHVSLSSDAIVKQRGRSKTRPKRPEQRQNAERGKTTTHPANPAGRCTPENKLGSRRNPQRAHKAAPPSMKGVYGPQPSPSTPIFTKVRKCRAERAKAGQGRRRSPRRHGNQPGSPPPPYTAHLARDGEPKPRRRRMERRLRDDWVEGRDAAGRGRAKPPHPS